MDKTASIFGCESTAQGWKFPEMTTAQRDDIENPARGLCIYNLDTKKLEKYPWPQTVCTGLTLIVTDLAGSLDTNVTDQTFIATNDTGTGPNISAAIGSQSFINSDNVIHLEMEYNSSALSGERCGVLFTEDSPFTPGLTPIIAGVSIDPSTGSIFDNDGSTIKTGVTMNSGYVISIDLDTENRTCTYTDSQGNAGPIFTIQYDREKPLFMGLVSIIGPGIGEFIESTINAGNIAFDLPTDGSITWCSA